MPAKTKALLMNLGAVLCWSFASLAIRYMSGYYPVLFQALLRYLTALIVMWVYTILSEGPAKLKEDLPRLLSLWPRLLLIATANYCFQVTFTYALYLLYPAFVTLVNQSVILFSVFLAALLFPDERPTLGSAIFLAGLVLAVIGVVLTIAGGEGFGTLQFNIGVLSVLACSASWAVLGALVRKWVVGISVSFALSSVFTVVTPLFALTYVLVSGGFPIPPAPAAIWALLVISGLLGLGVAHSLYYRSVGILGLALSSSLALLLPLLVGIGSFILYRETLTWVQLIGGAGLLLGCYLVIRARFRHIG